MTGHLPKVFHTVGEMQTDQGWDGYSELTERSRSERRGIVE